jgi:hypothetical protein
MSSFANAMEVYALLDRSNCRRCGEKTCLAFAGAVFMGGKDLDACPKIDPATLRRYAAGRPAAGDGRDLPAALLEQLRQLDPAEVVKRAGGRLCDDRMTCRILGKDFSVDREGNFFSDIHINHWLIVPFLTYLLRCKEGPVSGKWLSFREIPGGREQYPLFQKRCEEAMKQVADAWPELFDDIVQLFGGQRVAEQFASDISVVLYPLPKVPVMICYWREAEGIASTLNLFFDATVGDNLDVGTVFMLGTGMARMFERLAFLHGFGIAAG